MQTNDFLGVLITIFIKRNTLDIDSLNYLPSHVCIYRVSLTAPPTAFKLPQFSRKYMTRKKFLVTFLSLSLHICHIMNVRSFLFITLGIIITHLANAQFIRHLNCFPYCSAQLPLTFYDHYERSCMNRQENMWKWTRGGKVNKHPHDIMIELRLEAIAHITKSEWINFMASKISTKNML